MIDRFKFQLFLTKLPPLRDKLSKIASHYKLSESQIKLIAETIAFHTSELDIHKILITKELLYSSRHPFIGVLAYYTNDVYYAFYVSIENGNIRFEL